LRPPTALGLRAAGSRIALAVNVDIQSGLEALGWYCLQQLPLLWGFTVDDLQAATLHLINDAPLTQFAIDAR
jgi:hypothetical protein